MSNAFLDDRVNARVGKIIKKRLLPELVKSYKAEGGNYSESYVIRIALIRLARSKLGRRADSILSSAVAEVDGA